MMPTFAERESHAAYFLQEQPWPRGTAYRHRASVAPWSSRRDCFATRWRRSRDLYPFVGASLAAQGIVTVVPDYSIFPSARFPMFVEDAARAVRFVRENAAQWGGDPARLVLMGHSAGAYIAAMLAFDPQWLRQVGLNSRTDLAAFIGLAGPYDFLQIESKTLRTIFGGVDRAETQPISFVTGKETPSLLITARRDRLVSPGNSRRMAAKIHAYGGVVAERTYGGVGHLTLIGAFAPGLRVLAPVLRDVTQFVWRVTRRQADFCEVT
jgi:acetyl esterase/lipase